MQTETLKAQRNEVSKSVPARKKAGEDVTALFEEMKRTAEQIKEIDAELAEIDGAAAKHPFIHAQRADAGRAGRQGRYKQRRGAALGRRRGSSILNPRRTGISARP